jgi:hypothetical protein
MTAFRRHSEGLPNIFPRLGPVSKLVLFADFYNQDASPSEEEWCAECELLIRYGLAGVANRLIRQRSLAVPMEILRRLREAQFVDMTVSSTTVKKSAGGLEALRSARIPFVITKGPGIALEGINIADRPFMDLDVVVEPRRFMDARRVLASIGYAEKDRTKQPWDSLNRVCREAVNLRTEDGGSIDLHHRVPPWYWSSGLTLEVLKDKASSRAIFGVNIPLVAPEHNLLVAALHVVSDKSRPGQNYRVWRDVLVLARKCSTDAAAKAASDTNLTTWLAWILGCLPSEVQPRELLDRLRNHPARLQGSWRLRMILPPKFGSRHLLGQAFRLPAPNAALFAASMLVPSPEYLRMRYPDERHPYRTWWRSTHKNFTREVQTYET